MPWVGTWEGGRIWEAPKTRIRTYIIRRKVGGTEYVKSTRATKLRAALAHLKRFEENPEAYRPDGLPRSDRIYLDDALILEWFKYCDDDLGNEWEGLQKKRDYLMNFWQPKLKGKDLRHVTREELNRIIDTAPSPRNTFYSYRSLTAFLHKKGRLSKAQDASQTISIPPPPPAQWTESRVIPYEVHKAVIAVIKKPWGDILTVLAATGWHLSELHRFLTKGGAIVPIAEGKRVNGAVAVLVCPRHKSGDTHRTAVSQVGHDAAARLVARGKGFSEVNLRRAIKESCAEAEVPRFTPGSYRHSVATWALEKGTPIEAVAVFLGHRSPATTKKFYATLAVPPKIHTME